MSVGSLCRLGSLEHITMSAPYLQYFSMSLIPDGFEFKVPTYAHVMLGTEKIKCDVRSAPGKEDDLCVLSEVLPSTVGIVTVRFEHSDGSLRVLRAMCGHCGNLCKVHDHVKRCVRVPAETTAGKEKQTQMAWLGECIFNLDVRTDILRRRVPENMRGAEYSAFVSGEARARNYDLMLTFAKPVSPAMGLQVSQKARAFCASYSGSYRESFLVNMLETRRVTDIVTCWDVIDGDGRSGPGVVDVSDDLGVLSIASNSGSDMGFN